MVFGRPPAVAGQCIQMREGIDIVMAGLVPAISIRDARGCPSKRDARDKRGHDVGECVTPLYSFLTSIPFARLARASSRWSAVTRAQRSRSASAR